MVAKDYVNCYNMRIRWNTFKPQRKTMSSLCEMLQHENSREHIQTTTNDRCVSLPHMHLLSVLPARTEFPTRPQIALAVVFAATLEAFEEHWRLGLHRKLDLEQRAESWIWDARERVVRVHESKGAVKREALMAFAALVVGLGHQLRGT